MNIAANTIAFIVLLVADAMTAGLFMASRNDPNLRIAMLVAATATIAGNLAIASTLLTGKDVTKPRDPNELPANTTTVDTTTIQKGSPEPSKLTDAGGK